MATLTFKKGSTPHILHTTFMAGDSLTYDEAYENKKIRHLTQRVADLNKKFVEANITSPLMVIDEANERGGTHARYFYRGVGCPFEHRAGARGY